MKVFRRSNEAEVERVRRDLDDAEQFMHEVIDDPSLLDLIPSGATVVAVPKSRAEPGRPISFETPHMVVYIGPPPPYETLGLNGHASLDNEPSRERVLPRLFGLTPHR